jgi:hypothetical protein
MGAWNITQMMLVSLASTHDDFDIILVDDHSDFDIPGIAEIWGVDVLRWGNVRDGPMGLTHTWNLVWQYALDRGYKNLIIANNDILIPDGTIDKLTRSLSSGNWDVLIPTVSARGSVYHHHTLNQKFEGVKKWSDQPLHYQNVADSLSANYPASISRTNKINGYMMTFRVEALRHYQFNSSSAELFDPQFRNTKNEDDLFKRINGSLNTGVHDTAFVFHVKGYTVGRPGSGDRNAKTFQIGKSSNLV